MKSDDEGHEEGLLVLKNKITKPVNLNKKMKIKDEINFLLTLALIIALVEVTQAFKLNYLPSIQVDEKRFLASVKKVEKEDAKLFGPSNKQPQAQSRIFFQENEKKRKIKDEIEYSIGVRGNDYRLRFK